MDGKFSGGTYPEMRMGGNKSRGQMSRPKITPQFVAWRMWNAPTFPDTDVFSYTLQFLIWTFQTFNQKPVS